MRRQIGIGLVGGVILLVGCAAPDAGEEERAPRPVVAGSITPNDCNPNCLPAHEVRIHATISNYSTRPTAVVTPLIIDAIRAELLAEPDIDVDEGNDPTNTNHALEVFGRLNQTTFVGTTFTVKCSLDVFSYPQLDFRGSINKTITALGVSPRDQATQNNVIATCAKVATDTFIANLDDFE